VGTISDLSPKEIRALERLAKQAGVKPVTILKRALADYLGDRADYQAGMRALAAARGKRLVTLEEYEAKRGLSRQAHTRRRKAA
jgi:predicted transcriptional regulator